MFVNCAMGGGKLSRVLQLKAQLLPDVPHLNRFKAKIGLS